MGTWDTGVFGSDGALDLLDEFIDQGPEAIAEALSAAEPDGASVMAAAELFVHARGGTVDAASAAAIEDALAGREAGLTGPEPGFLGRLLGARVQVVRGPDADARRRFAAHLAQLAARPGIRDAALAGMARIREQTDATGLWSTWEAADPSDFAAFKEAFTALERRLGEAT